MDKIASNDRQSRNYPAGSDHIFQLLVESVQDHAIYMLDPDGQVITWNSSAERCKGYSAEEILGRNYACFFPPEAIAEGIPQEHLRIARETGRFEEQDWRVRKDGSRFWAGISLSVVRDAEGQLLGFAKLTHDLTAERELRRLRLDKDRAEAADRAKSLFLANMSHELRTPLNAIIGFTQLTMIKAAPKLESDIKEYLGYVEESAHRLLRLIENVLDLSKIEEGYVSLSIEALDARAVLSGIEREARTLAARTHQTLSIETVNDGRLIRGDRVRITQILLNFISNAAKYGREHGRIEVGCTTLKDHRVEFYVSDDGPGIAADKQAKVFEPFQRLGFESSAIEGTGVGLSIAQKLALAMNGEIGFTSTPGKGTRFYVRFETTNPPRLEFSSAATDPQLLADLPPIRILYVEDNPTNLLLFSRAISNLSKAKLSAVPTAKGGLKQARSDPPDLIVTDIHLPDFDGFELLRRLKLDRRTRDIPVVALSADAQSETIARGLAAGFTNYLTKPVRVQGLIEALWSALPPTKRQAIHIGVNQDDPTDPA